MEEHVAGNEKNQPNNDSPIATRQPDCSTRDATPEHHTKPALDVRLLFTAGEFVAFIFSAAMLGAVIWYAKTAVEQRDELHTANQNSELQMVLSRGQSKTARQQLEATERPWIQVEPEISGPITWDANQANFRFRFSTKNVGHSVATQVRVNAKVIAYGVFKGVDFFQPINEQKTMCEALRRAAPDPHNFGNTLFPGESGSANWTQGLSIGVINAALIPFKGTARKFFEPVLVGCADYRFSYSPIDHQTGFIYMIYRFDPAHPAHGLSIETGKTLPVNRIALDRYFFGGTYAD